MLISNHGGMRYLFDQPKLIVRQAGWLDLINEFNFEIKHIEGKGNKVAYALTKSLQVAHLAVVSICEVDIKEGVKEALLHDEHYQNVKECLQNKPKGSIIKKYNSLMMLCHCSKIENVLGVTDLRNFIMDEFHKRPYSGHLGY